MIQTSKYIDLTVPVKSKDDSQIDHQLLFDQVTGLYNHSAFHFYLGQEIKRADRYQKVFAVALIGIDDFAYYNEANSYIEGDLMLRKIGQAIRSSIRDVDVIARFSDDQYSLLLTETEEKKAFLVAERIKREISSCYRQKINR
ncbi:MAG: GGDEF domain-containing protein [Candidatus Competibacteraceae bacterium]|nr:GGDEF domain-containing protein [Candidatus Competibacteraceae bacterium]